MGIYSHYSIEQLRELRDALVRSLHDRLTLPTTISSGDRNARFDQRVEDIRAEAIAVCAEMELREGSPLSPAGGSDG